MTTSLQRMLYTVPDAADQLSISARKLEQLIRDGQVDSVLIGRRRLVPADALHDYIKRLRRAS